DVRDRGVLRDRGQVRGAGRTGSARHVRARRRVAARASTARPTVAARVDRLTVGPQCEAAGRRARGEPEWAALRRRPDGTYKGASPMPSVGRAAVFFGPGKPFEIREVPLPEIEPDAVLIKVSLANVCGSDLHFWRGDAPLRLPEDGWIFGHEMTGRVAKLGRNVKTDSLGRPLREGDRVAYTYFYPCGRCYVCLNKQPAAVAKDMGASTVIVVDQLPGRLELARAFGADHVINVKEVAERKERVTLVRKWTGGMGADVACDFVGFPQVIPEGIEMLRPGGAYLEIGTISRGAKVELEPATLVWGAKKIVGVIMYDAAVIPRALDFLVRNRTRFPFDRLISHKYPLEQINQAFSESEWHNRETTKISRAALVP